MALVKGTNWGFVTVAPIADPDELATRIDGNVWAIRDVSPGMAIRITEIGIWIDNPTQATDMEAAIYLDNGDYPDTIVGSKYLFTKGTTAGWKSVVTDIPLSASTTYWIAIQVDSTSFTATNTDFLNLGGTKLVVKDATQTELVSPFPEGGYEYPDFKAAIYAVWEEAPVGTNMKINISDVWKDIDSLKINIGDAWKNVIKIQQNIGDVWKTVFD
ncbi:hypothetical protein ES703_32359 [subsurface metagenome]